jgi:membrane spanning protein
MNELKNLIEQTKKKEKINKNKTEWNWIFKVVLISFTLSIIMSYVSTTTIPNINIIAGTVVTLLFIGLGILFDIIGVAVTSADEKVFNSMSARKIKGASLAVKMKKSAPKVSSLCCDIVGDTCGIISGTATATIATNLSKITNINILLVTLLASGIAASLTIGGKAIGKSFAMNKSNIILYEFAKIISIFAK